MDLQPFVPHLLSSRLFEEATTIEQTLSKDFEAVIVFIDIAGFTAMVEELRSQGKRGAERTQEILNSVFTPLADLITKAGGEVLCFPGDAVLAFFPLFDGEELRAPAMRAVNSAQIAIAELNGLRVDAQREVHLRIVVGAGSVRAAAMGGVDGRYEILVHGNPLASLSDTMAATEPGEVLLSADAHAVLAGEVTGQRRGSSYCVEQVTPPPDFQQATSKAAKQICEALVPRSVQTRLSAGLDDYLAEFRRVSVVFVSFSGHSDDVEIKQEQLQATFTATQEITSNLGGSVNQVVSDDKGTVFLLGFGVALHNHEDDASRAVLAALRISKTFRQLGLEPHIGIATDDIFTGLRGSPRRCEYAFIGSAVNLASRLMQHASPILCDGQTKLASRQRILFESLSPLWVKGHSEGVLIYRPQVEHTRSSTSLLSNTASLVGRDPEHQILERQLAELVTRGTGGIVFVEGEPGIGKTSLVRQLIDSAQRTSVRTLVGAGDATERQNSLLAWQKIVKDLLGVYGIESEDALLNRLIELLPNQDSSLYAVLNPVLPLRLSETDAVHQLAPQGRGELIRSLVTQLLQSATQTVPLLLILDDGHWMDSSSWELAEAVQRDVPRLMLLICMRPMTERPPPCSRLLDDINTTVVRLDSIDSQECLALACRLLDVDSLPEEVAEFIRERAEGHPLYIEELVRALRDGGYIEVEAGECHLTGSPVKLNNLNVSQTISGLISSRIDALEPEQQMTLKVASVMGRHFDLNGLSSIHPLNQVPDRLAEELQVMASLGLLRSLDDNGQQWDFHHALIRDSAYELLPYKQRCVLHRSTAEWLEEQYGDDLSSVHSALGYHYEFAEDLPKAIQHLVSAGDDAIAHYVSTEAVHFFERVIAIDTAAGASAGRLERASWERRLGEAFVMLGKHEQGVPFLQTALGRLDETLPDSRLGLMRRLIPRMIKLALVKPTLPKRSVNTDEDGQLIREVLTSLTRLSGSAYPRGVLLEGLYLMLRAKEVARQLGPSAELAHVYVGIANVAASVGRMKIARLYAAQAVEMAEDAGDLSILGNALCSGQLFEITVANFDVIESMERGLSLLEQVGNHYLWEEGALTLAHFANMQGRLKYAIGCAEGVLDRAVNQSAVVRQLWSLAEIADCQLRLGDLDKAIATAQETLRIKADSGSVDTNAPFRAVGVLASAWIRLHRVPPPADILSQGHKLLHAGAWQSYTPQAGFSGLIEASLIQLDSGQGSKKEHLQALADLDKRLRSTVFLRPVVKWLRLWLQAELEWRADKQVRACKTLRAAIEDVDAYDLPFESSQLRVRLTRKLGDDDPARSELLAEARQGFSAVNAAWELKSLEELSQ